jgi:hypothetical protein
MRRLTVAVVIGLFVLGMIALGGCGGAKEEADQDSSAYAGTYVSEQNPADFIEIESNNTFRMSKGGKEVSGSCAVEDGSLLLSAGSFSETMKISGDTITDSDGAKFSKNGQPQSFDPLKEAIEKYRDENGITMPDLVVSQEKTVSVQDPSWEIDYAFPAEAEGTGQFFLLHKTGDGWAVVAHTEAGATGWTAEQLGALGAPTDLATQ